MALRACVYDVEKMHTFMCVEREICFFFGGTACILFVRYACVYVSVSERVSERERIIFVALDAFHLCVCMFVCDIYIYIYISYIQCIYIYIYI